MKCYRAFKATCFEPEGAAVPAQEGTEYRVRQKILPNFEALQLSYFLQ